MAKIPLRPPAGRLIWNVCGAPAVTECRYRCEHGHERIGLTCPEHRPVPDAVGCAQCIEQFGHDCPMIAEHLRELCPESKMESGAHSLEWEAGDLCSWCGSPVPSSTP